MTPKYARNTKAARYFINFMCRSDIALRNMEAIGYVSAVATPEILEAKIDDQLEGYSNLNYFFGEGADSVKVDPVQYPDASIINRCAMMHDSGKRTEQMLEMWTRVKGDNVSPWILTVIALSLGAVLALGIRRKMKQIQHDKAKHSRRRKRKA